MLIKTECVDRLKVKIFNNRAEMGRAAAADFALYMKNLLSEKESANVIFAAAPSQLDFLDALKNETIDWNRVNVFHMDEYVGMPITSGQSFAGFVKKYIADVFPAKQFYPLKGAACDIAKECLRYTELLKANPVDVVCLGIGENTHIAFNDPGIADFWDGEYVKVVTLDEVCRQQQVHDKCFDTIGDVPKQAMTLTVPTLMRGAAMFCMVPAKTKADAVYRTVREPIDIMHPASALRLHKNAVMYCDMDSGKYLTEDR